MLWRLPNVLTTSCSIVCWSNAAIASRCSRRPLCWIATTISRIGAYEAVVDQVRRSIPCVIVDLPHAWTPWARQTLLAADEIVLVATPDLASLRNTKNMLDVIRARRPNDMAPKLIVNQVGMPKRPEIPIKEFAAAVDLQPALVLPFDPQLFGTAANNGQMIPEVQPAAPASEGVRKLAGLITKRTVSHVSEEVQALLPAVHFQPQGGLTHVRQAWRCRGSRAPAAGARHALSRRAPAAIRLSEAGGRPGRCGRSPRRRLPPPRRRRRPRRRGPSLSLRRRPSPSTTAPTITTTSRR